MSAEKKSRSARFSQAMCEALVQAYAKHQDSNYSAQADHQLGQTRKRPAPKTLAQAQLEVRYNHTIYIFKMIESLGCIIITVCKLTKKAQTNKWN